MDFLGFIRDDIRSVLAGGDDEYRNRHADWLQKQLSEDGGFKNRRGNSELYYTTFALRSLSSLNQLSIESAKQSGAYLKSLLKKPDRIRIHGQSGAFYNAVSIVSWWDAARLCGELDESLWNDEDKKVAEELTRLQLNSLRREDGGWAKTPEDNCGGLYHTFLAACSYLRMGESFPDPDKIRDFVKQRESEDGGFLESKYSKRPGTNGTAAGIALLLLLGEPIEADRHVAFLKTQRNEEGGFQATPGAPMADLLSTYTGLFGMKMLDREDDAYKKTAAAYADMMEQERGGYIGFAMETKADCEYTFYGLGVKAIST